MPAWRHGFPRSSGARASLIGVPRLFLGAIEQSLGTSEWRGFDRKHPGYKRPDSSVEK
ncbi:hypothetical protein [Microcoleus sp. D2_18a_D3]|uniref:hypothetical protein n=1 Tax=Microcoleus sp. D2_18a_D3 TaxID=3055330 RepID=UPI002FD11A37